MKNIVTIKTIGKASILCKKHGLLSCIHYLNGLRTIVDDDKSGRIGLISPTPDETRRLGRYYFGSSYQIVYVDDMAVLEEISEAYENIADLEYWVEERTYVKNLTWEQDVSVGCSLWAYRGYHRDNVSWTRYELDSNESNLFGLVINRLNGLILYEHKPFNDIGKHIDVLIRYLTKILSLRVGNL